ncbi:extracellular solute-binding protein family 1 [Sulfobacillus acidophilus TPY]|uniref:Carbohydrate ABC transporter substrate-binding protein, CUT1 family n=1 Tax=Sulfobacillus acidophilus (strain ATCC 700253 / DSM 10332 / NAL) TaxID=679936 RepID=G8TTM6_SULAD|nr:extracellular solute-binding protein family 1 [Sulfobacillus acidophilus TPY]AEW05692.1 carbohydrate ABC transporter substrate-binding protein, CUT1 family [Sulfobacillus acidophilus DSM 10332]
MKAKTFIASVSAAVLMNGLSACGSTTGTSPAAGYVPGSINRQFAGTTITVLLPPWGAMPASQLAKFTKETGIHVNLEIMPWDDIHDKVVTAEAAHVSPADVTEVDWSWVGQFGDTGWYTPLNHLISPTALKNSLVANIFTVHHQLIAMPYNFDFRETTLNWKDFQEAGITTVPTTWAQLLADAKLIKAKGIVQYPIGMPLSITEGTSTDTWYTLIKSAGGQIFGPNWTPLFTAPNSIGAQALEYIKTLYQDGLVPPGEVQLTDVQTATLFAQNKVAALLGATPIDLSEFLSPQTSTVYKDDIRIIRVPGLPGHPSGVYGLPEGLGIPKLSTHQGAAAEFINWWMQTPQLMVSYHNPNMGNPPPEKYALDQLIRTGQLAQGQEIETLLKQVTPLFPQGTPPWYPQFSTDVATMVQSVVENRIQPLPALQQLANEVHAIVHQGG